MSALISVKVIAGSFLDVVASVMDCGFAKEFSHIVRTYFRMLVPEINLEDPGVVHEAVCPAGFNYLLRCSEYNIRRCIADGGKASSRPGFRRDPGSPH